MSVKRVCLANECTNSPKYPWYYCTTHLAREMSGNHQTAAKLIQVGGDHYVKYAIQPWDIIDCYGLNFYEGSALKYLLRHRDKGGVEDLKKARHYLDAMIKKAETE